MKSFSEVWEFFEMKSLSDGKNSMASNTESWSGGDEESWPSGVEESDCEDDFMKPHFTRVLCPAFGSANPDIDDGYAGDKGQTASDQQPPTKRLKKSKSTIIDDGYAGDKDQTASDQEPPPKRRLRGKQSIPTPVRRTVDNFASDRGLSRASLLRLLHFGVPMILLNVLFYIHQHHQPIQNLDCVEFYSGIGVIAESFQEAGLRSRTFDIGAHRVQQDATSPEGFLNQMYLAMSTKELYQGGGISHWATVCSSWVFMSRDSTGRSSERPEGYQSRPCVAIGNCQVSRMCLILAFFAATLRHWILEQPATSIMREATWMKWVRRISPTFHIRTWLGMYGAATMKPTQLESGSAWSLRLHRQRDSTRDAEWAAVEGVHHETPDSTSGRIRVTGHSGLKRSQEYPKGYGQEVLRQFAQGRAELTEPPADDDGSDSIDIDWDKFASQRAFHNVDWRAANLEDIAEFLSIPMERPL